MTGKPNPLFNLDALCNINTDDYFIKGVNISNVFPSSNIIQTSITNLSNLTNAWTKSGSLIIYTNSNVGINKANPTYNLDVIGNINFTGNLTKNGVVFNNFSGNYEDLNNRPNITWSLGNNHTFNNNVGNVGEALINTICKAANIPAECDGSKTKPVCYKYDYVIHVFYIYYLH